MEVTAARRVLEALETGPGLAAAPVLAGPAGDPGSWIDWLRVVFAQTPDRFRHVRTVWQRAAEVRQHDLAWLTPARARRLELAALLHDVGRAIDPGNREPHGFVGARLLDTMGLPDAAALVAHHSGAQHEARARGMAHLDVWTDDDPDLLSVLTFLDRTTSPSGERVTIAQRRLDLANRYGPTSLSVEVFDLTLPQVRRARYLLGLPDPTTAPPPPADVPVTLLLRVVPSAAAAGDVVGQIEAVETGEVVTVRAGDDLRFLVCRLAAPLEG